MAPELDAIIAYGTFKLAAGTALAGVFAWLGGGHDEDEDEEIAECHDLVLDALSDADGVRSIELHVDANIREQLSIEDVEAIHQDAERRRWSWRVN